MNHQERVTESFNSPTCSQSIPIHETLQSFREGDIELGTLMKQIEEIGNDRINLDAIKRSLIDISEEIVTLRKNANELRALYSSARELAEFEDRHELIQRLLQRAHELLSSDVTYLSKFDPENGDLHVEQSLGNLSHRFTEIYVPPGKGMAAEIVRSRNPLAVSNYFSQDLEHEQGIDQAIKMEGIISILGVPLLSKQRVLGVLFTAKRKQHVFHTNEISLLASLASLASVAIQTTETLRLLRLSEKQSTQALETLALHVEERDRSNLVHQQLVSALLGHGELGDIARILTTALDRPIYIAEDGAKGATSALLPTLDGFSGPPSGLDVLESQEFSSALDSSKTTGRSTPFALSGNDQLPLTVCSVHTPQRYWGYLLCGPGSSPLSDVDMRTIERAAQVCAMFYLQREAVEEADRRRQEDLVVELINNGSSPEVSSLLTRRGYRPDSLTHLVVFGAGCQARSISRFDQRNVLAGTVNGHPTVICDESFWKSIRAAADTADSSRTTAPSATTATARSTTTVGPTISTIGEQLSCVYTAIPTLDDVPRAFQQCADGTRLLPLFGDSAVYVDSAQLAPFISMFSGDAEKVHQFVRSTLGPRFLSSKQAPVLIETLDAYFDHGHSAAGAARALHFHPNTIHQRLTMVDSLLGEQWRQAPQSFLLSVAVKFESLRSRFISPH